MLKSLVVRNNELANTDNQLAYLNSSLFTSQQLPTFKDSISKCGAFPLKPHNLQVLQVNVGYLCNQVCAHCHVDAGPDRKEIMTRNTFDIILTILANNPINTLDITGGAPEMNPNFRYFVVEAHKIGVKNIMVRSNLTIITANKIYHDLPDFFAQHQVQVVSSLPFYKKEPTDKQRGKGVFDKSIEALKMLNNVGYGKANSGLVLDLVYNPAGAFLPPKQSDLEKEFKKSLFNEYQIEFNKLFAITNLPISRFLEYLLISNNFEDYMQTLIDAYNPNTLQNVMCRNTISVNWNGYLYDCDFNQMLGLKVNSDINHITNFNNQLLQNRSIAISQHCYGCTAGAGSSCTGTIV